MRHIDTVIIGGGQAGLAMSQSLADRGVEHVVLERGRVGERWRSERWDSLRLLTPRWLSTLSSLGVSENPHDFMTRKQVIRHLEMYESRLAIPVQTGVTVESVKPCARGYVVDTDNGSWTALNVVIATGESQRAYVPTLAGELTAEVDQVVPTHYKNPSQLADGGVLVVGASATGLQLAAEIHTSGRPVTLSVGRHTRMPRRYRGHDILWWLDQMGVLNQRAEDVQSLSASRGQPSLQLVGSRDNRSLDLGDLQAAGVRIVGRTCSANGNVVTFGDDLLENVAAADFKLASLRLRIDRAIRAGRVVGGAQASDNFDPIRLPDPPERLSLRDAGIRTVLWATGFTRSYPWLRVPVLDRHGEIMQTGGITKAPGLYTLGLNFQIRRTSSFIAGAPKDAEEIASHLVARRSSSAQTGVRAAVA